jgi:hypothetical protein
MITTVSGTLGRGSTRHNLRTFTAANVDSSRTKDNIIFVNKDLKQTYHELFDEALAAYNAGKKKTRDKIPNYYEHIRTGKQEKLFYEAIFQVGNMSDCGHGTRSCTDAARALTAFAQSFQERNPHLQVFCMTLHMDEATPHIHVDFIPVATEQKRGLSTRVSLTQALNQQGFTGTGKRSTGWMHWIEHEKSVLSDIAAEYGLETIPTGEPSRRHMALPEFKEAMRACDAAKKEVSEAKKEYENLSKSLSEARDAISSADDILKAHDSKIAVCGEIEAIKSKRKPTIVGNKTILPTEDFEKLLAGCEATAAAEARAKIAEREAAAAKREAASAQNELRREQAARKEDRKEFEFQLDEQKRYVDYGKFVARMFRHMPYRALVETLGKYFSGLGVLYRSLAQGIVNMAYWFVDKEPPQQECDNVAHYSQDEIDETYELALNHLHEREFSKLDRQHQQPSRKQSRDDFCL